MRNLSPRLIIAVKKSNERLIEAGERAAVRENLELVLAGDPSATRLFEVTAGNGGNAPGRGRVVMISGTSRLRRTPAGRTQTCRRAIAQRIALPRLHWPRWLRSADWMVSECSARMRLSWRLRSFDKQGIGRKIRP
jgi:hypothetical protein